MNRYLKAEELPYWDAIAVTLKIEDESSTTYYTNRYDLKPGIDLIPNADSDNGGWSRWGHLIVEEILPDGIKTSLGELTTDQELFEVYPNVYPYRDGYLTAKLLNMNYKVTVDDPESGKSYTAYIPRQRYQRDSNFLEPLIAMVQEYFPEAKGCIKYLESLRPTPTTEPIKWRVSVYKDMTCGLYVESGLYPEGFNFPGTVQHEGTKCQVVTVDGGGSRRCGDLKKLTFAKGIKRIEGFNDCIHLTSVTLPPTLEELSYKAFANCGQLAEIAIPESVKDIGTEALSGTNITEVQLPQNLEKLRYGAFAHTPIRSIAIPEKVSQISDGCFKDCHELVEATLSEGIRVIEKMAFKNCTKLTRINIPDGVRYIGEEAFADCASLKEVSLPKYVLLHPDAFKDCACEITYRDTAEIPSWRDVKIVQRQWYDEKDKLDFKYNKTYQEISADPDNNKVCGDSCGFYSVYITAFNEKFVCLKINCWDYVLIAGESVKVTSNMSRDNIITVM